MTGPQEGRPEAPRQQPKRPPGAQGRKKKDRSQVFFAAAGVGGVLVVVLILVLAVMWPKEKTERRQAEAKVPMSRPVVTGLAPDSYSSSPSTEVFAEIATREEDSAPLSAEEMFPKKDTLKDEVSGAEPALRLSVLDDDCGKAVWGRGLGEVLQDGGCTQAVRGLYTDEKKGFRVLVAVYNLGDEDAADRAVEAFGAGSGGFVKLPDKSPKGFGEGFSLARGLAMGHYALITWADRADGKGEGTSGPLLSLVVTAAKAEGIYARAAG
ncbi:hypothetical protein [Actinocorallia populi]|uniref:hypothetical protein n=1 Tax=Actinocorallia populi TaxID=2079200 RepID=UPI000D08A817|nr:hypothetical protein [Actinocorallia populi]